MSLLPPAFAGLDVGLGRYDAAETVVLPVPFERTTSYGKGTAMGPQALLEASAYLELYDEELDDEPYRQGIHTLEPLVLDMPDLADAMRRIERAVTEQLESDKFVLTVGGEHSLSLGPVRAAQARYPELAVVQFDAHTDQRNRYQGTPYSHACVMRRICDLGLPTLSVGPRSLSPGEAAWIRHHGRTVLWGHELDSPDLEQRFTERLAELPNNIYLTFDVDFFDPSLLPATGTPEPGGGFWYPTLRLLRKLFTLKRVVAMDIVELAPIDGQPASDFIAARLAYKCLGYRRITDDTAA
ncbi:MAG: agmatinase [Acidobacteriota bacterium]